MTHAQIAKVEHIANMLARYTAAWGWSDAANRKYLDEQILMLINDMKGVDV